MGIEPKKGTSRIIVKGTFFKSRYTLKERNELYIHTLLDLQSEVLYKVSLVSVEVTKC